MLSYKPRLQPIDVAGGRYRVQSEKNAAVYYITDARFGICSCPAGVHGHYCKHLRIVYHTWFAHLHASNMQRAAQGLPLLKQKEMTAQGTRARLQIMEN